MTLEEDLQKVLEAQRLAGQGLDAISERILNGESLGNKIKDFLFLNYRTADVPVLGETLQKLSDDVKAHDGQPVMVLYVKSKIIHERGCFGSSISSFKVVGEQLGIINGDLAFDLKNSRVVLPSSKHVQKGEECCPFDVRKSQWKLTGGGIAVNGYHFDQRFSPYESLAKLNILFGDEIELYFTVGGGRHFEHYLNSRSEILKEHLLKERPHVDKGYIEALNLLGAEAPARFKEKYDAQVRRHRDKVLKGISSQENVRDYLDQALVLGLHKEKMELQLESGITMNVSEYIKAQCIKYGVKVPE